MDVLRLIGFTTIAATGLVISTWLNLSLGNFTLWLNLHIAVSISTLETLLLELAFHWCWLVGTTRKLRKSWFHYTMIVFLM